MTLYIVCRVDAPPSGTYKIEHVYGRGYTTRARAEITLQCFKGDGYYVIQEIYYA